MEKPIRNNFSLPGSMNLRDFTRRTFRQWFFREKNISDEQIGATKIIEMDIPTTPFLLGVPTIQDIIAIILEQVVLEKSKLNNSLINIRNNWKVDELADYIELELNRRFLQGNGN